MPRCPDFDQLLKGSLYFPASSAEDDRRLQFADGPTWAAWAAVCKAELWQLVALATSLDPRFLPWRELSGPVGTVAGLFGERLACAEQAVQTGALRALGGDDAGQGIVQVADFVRWAEAAAICLPPLFPRGDCSLVPGPTRRARQQPKPQPDEGYIRQAELLALLPFSAATLWRKVKAATFPKPVKLSAAVTAWKRGEVAAWLAARQGQTRSRSRSRKRCMA